MHLIVRSSINHLSVLQHSLCILLVGFDCLLTQMVTVLKTDLYLHTPRLECSIDPLHIVALRSLQRRLTRSSSAVAAVTGVWH